MVIGGVVATALMLGAGALAVANGPAAGPDRAATWPAGETMTLSRVPGERNSGETTTTCTVTPEGQPGERDWFTVGESYAPDFTGSATITCDQPVALMTGGPRIVADHTRGPLVAVPIFVALLGVLFFFPRFTYVWAKIATWFR